MQLTRFTDFGLRVLMYLCAPAREQAVTVAEIAERFEVSRHHLNKVVQFLAQQGWVVTSRGKGGGLALAQPPSHYRLGQLIRTLEGDVPLIDCAEPPCALHRRCGLKPLLDEALDAFYTALDAHTLADTHTPKTQQVIVKLQRQAVSRP
ncbi:RrF2 family transcriptional regulator [Ideonella paludis]|uniref:Rrf2 family transcriptional regulator n=1 Tax=Ideonella paludis TaxID=1233411 RepID=A0ABS5DTV1_9BURK|nr:Rrf2 family transcriptional regulator [Ideonella paludis]MBQ0934311.1 Rrf2 family transcriptional regulator [Ideonella paludis]